MSDPRPLRRAVIKEELVALTGDPTSALILNQMLFWNSEYTYGYDALIAEEQTRAAAGGDDPSLVEALPKLLTHGWVTKTREQIGESIMIGVQVQTIGTYLSNLINHGWILTRKSPKYRWDRTLQYRPDLIKIQTDLHALGFPLDGYPLIGAAASQNAQTRDPNAIQTNGLHSDHREVKISPLDGPNIHPSKVEIPPLKGREIHLSSIGKKLVVAKILRDDVGSSVQADDPQTRNESGASPEQQTLFAQATPAASGKPPRRPEDPPADPGLEPARKAILGAYYAKINEWWPGTKLDQTHRQAQAKCARELYQRGHTAADITACMDEIWNEDVNDFWDDQNPILLTTVSKRLAKQEAQDEINARRAHEDFLRSRTR